MSTLLAGSAGQATHAHEDARFEVAVERLTDISHHPHDLYISMIARQLHQCAHAGWLDVGCGWRLDFPWEFEREKEMTKGANIVGIDPDWQAVTRHRTILKKTVGLVEGLPFADGSFDIVTANVVVEHLEFPSLAFSEIFRVLRLGGSFIFRTPSAKSYFVKIARVLPQSLKVRLATGIIENRQAADVYRAYYRANTSETITEISRLAGFRKLEIVVTRARGVLNKLPRLRRVERALMEGLGFTEGNLIVRVSK